MSSSEQRGPGRPRVFKLTAKEFAALVPRALARKAFTATRIEAARLALVDGLSVPAIVERLGLPGRHVVDRAVTAFLRLRSAGRVHMSAHDFELLRPVLVAKGTNDRRIEAARLALVEDEPAALIAKRLGWASRQAVDSAVTAVLSVRQAFADASDAAPPAPPPGWVQITLVVPAEMAELFREEAEKVRLLHSKT